jgi:twitching motility protein PilT
VTQVDFAEIITNVVAAGASDLHITVGAPPVMRTSGELVALGDRPLTSQDTRDLVYGLLTEGQRQRLENDLEVDISYAVPGRARFRVNAYHQRGCLGAAFRVVPDALRTLEELGIPSVLHEWAMLPRGLVLVTGPTGSGKSTTLAALINEVNERRRCHIVTVEDPIEFLHSHRNSLVNQREVGGDTQSFANALRSALRQDPDVILVGEMRDLETIRTALTAAETGHLVLATLHTSDAPQTIDRIIDVFPPHQQDQVRVMLAAALRGVCCQRLRATGQRGRAVACEVMVSTPAVRNLVREGKTHQIHSMIQTGSAHGMVSMDASLAALVRRGVIAPATAFERAGNVEELRSLMGSPPARSSGAAAPAGSGQVVPV